MRNNRSRTEIVVQILEIANKNSSDVGYYDDERI
jgi:predicted transcriptional regulator